jgi:hypothetical protein
LKEKKERGWKVITMVRNHWDYAVSFYYEHHSREDIFFDDFLLSEFSQMTWHRPEHTNLPRGMPRWNTAKKLFWLLPQLATYTFRYEDFPANLVPLLGKDVLELENVNPSSRRPYHEYYSDATRDWIGGRYRKEIQKYDYSYQPHGGNDGEVGKAEPEPLGNSTGDDG